MRTVLFLIVIVLAVSFSFGAGFLVGSSDNETVPATEPTPQTNVRTIEVKQVALHGESGSEVGWMALYFMPSPAGARVLLGYEASSLSPAFCFSPNPNFYAGALAQSTRFGGVGENLGVVGLALATVEPDGSFRWVSPGSGSVQLSGRLEGDGSVHGTYTERPFGSDNCAGLSF